MPESSNIDSVMTAAVEAAYPNSTNPEYEEGADDAGEEAESGDDGASGVDSGDEGADPEADSSDDGIGDDTGGLEPTVKVEADPEPAKPEKPAKEEPKPAEKEPEPDDKDNDLGPARDAKGKESKVPHSRVKVMVAKGEAKGEARAEARLKAEYEPKLAEYTKYKSGVEQTESIMFGNPQQFLALLEEKVPGYKELLTARKAEIAASTADEPEPGPDTPDGYSAEGLKKLMSWQSAQTRKQVMQELKPLTEEQARRKADEEFQAKEMPRIKAKLERVRKEWDGFKDNEQAIQQALHGDPNLNLAEAYMGVVFPKMRAELQAKVEGQKELEDRIRAKVIAELKKQPASTSTSTPSGKPVAAGKKSVDNIMLEIARGLK